MIAVLVNSVLSVSSLQNSPSSIGISPSTCYQVQCRLAFRPENGHISARLHLFIASVYALPLSPTHDEMRFAVSRKRTLKRASISPDILPQISDEDCLALFFRISVVVAVIPMYERHPLVVCVDWTPTR
jgi:hypothetical protein